MNIYSESYKDAGVDVLAGYKSIELMRAHADRTAIKGVLSVIGGFGGLFEPDLTGIAKPVFVAGADGVGTKLKLAFLMNRHDTVGIDCVAMCVNDIVCSGAKPLFFLDYIACGKNVPEKIAKIVKGVSDGCIAAGCALIGGETAEHPGLMPEDEYDLAGFTVGVIDKERLVKPETQEPGDVIIALKSSGVHSNGFSLIRKVFNINAQILARHYSEIGGTLGDCLMTPTKIYVGAVLSLLDAVNVKSLSNITGGGLIENIPRSLPDGLSANIRRAAIQSPPVFDLIAAAGNIPDRDMLGTFNMGVGMTAVVGKNDVGKALETLISAGEEPYVLGELAEGGEGIVIG
jgi:phosphoribosylformylglycinamidine cyclo-ligase